MSVRPQLLSPAGFPNGQGSVELVASVGWITALTRAASAIRAAKLVVVMGRPGVGKSTLLQCLAEGLRQAGHSAVMLEPGTQLPGHRSIVLIDDAERLGRRALASLVRRSIGCVLAGSPELVQRLKVRASRLEIVTIPGVDSLEIGNFVTKALRAAGEPGDLVSRDAVATLDEHCDGSPGRILATLRLAIFLARMELGETVNSRHVSDAVGVDDRVRTPGPDDLDLGLGDNPANAAAWIKPLLSSTQVTRFTQDHGRALAWGIPCAVAVCAAWLFVLRHLPLDSQPPEAATGPTPAGESAAVVAAPPPAEPAANPPAAPAVASAPEPSLPANDQLHVTVFAPDGDELALSRAAAIVSALRSRGYDVADQQQFPGQRQALEVHYFFVDDGNAAANLAVALDETPGLAQLVPASRALRARPLAAEIWLPATHIVRPTGRPH